ncbi:MAG: DUF3800 domain-containing protein [Candidatus Woesearchaeota archaeon]|nr:DUF3800 domain-containing protein [Candidatus Woesearchaeota archaeon]
MEFAYLDESGDLGARGSKKLVLCLVCTSERKKINKIIRKTKQRLLEKKKTTDWLNRKAEIKFYSFPDKPLLIRTLEALAKIDLKIYYLCFHKNSINFDKKLKQNILGQLFWHIFQKPSKEKPESVISDLDFLGKKPSYFALLDYKQGEIELQGTDGIKRKGVRDEAVFTEIKKEEYEQFKQDKGSLVIKIEPKNSRLTEELQAVDLICGAIYQYFENNNSLYFNIIKEKAKGIELQKK